jgi:class 3 adenylate cyclase
MPLYIDIHQIEGASPEDVASAHLADMRVQAARGVNYLKYWHNPSCGKVFCLVEAPSAEAAAAVHREAHGLVAQKIIEVTPEIAEAFLGDANASPSGAAVLSGPAGVERDTGTRTVLFTDIVGSTDLTQRFGDDAAMELVKAHDRIVRAALATGQGREVKHTGDGIMACFASAVCAMRSACQVQAELARHNAASDRLPLKLRIGAAAGEPVEHNNDLFGATVQLAARLCSAAAPDQILVSSAVAEACLGKELDFHEHEPIPLKGFERPVRTFLVRWSD